MAFCMGGWIVLLDKGFSRCNIHDTKGAVICWILAIVVIGLGIWAFHQAAKIGRKQDEEQAIKDENARLQREVPDEKLRKGSKKP